MILVERELDSRKMDKIIDGKRVNLYCKDCFELRYK